MPSSKRKALILRCQLVLFSSYRSDQYADPEGFKTSLGAVLEGFPDEVIVYVCDPRTGIQRRLKWPPTISEVVEACEQHQDHLARLRKPRSVPMERADSPRIADMAQGQLAQVFVPESHPRYAKLVEWTETATPAFWKHGQSSDGRRGLWVSYEIWQSGKIRP